MVKIIFTLCFGFSALSIASIEQIDSECKIQAKELAVQSYQSCVKENRNVKIEQIRKEYQEKLTELKSYYDSELKKLSPQSMTQAPVASKKKSNLKTKKYEGNGLPPKIISTKTLPANKDQPEPISTQESGQQMESDSQESNTSDL